VRNVAMSSHGVYPCGNSPAGCTAHYNCPALAVLIHRVPTNEVKMPSRPNRLKRCLFWTGIALGLLVFYIASWPFVFFWCERNLHAGIPVVRAVYAPLEVYSRNEWPGSRMYGQYTSWCISTLQEHSRGDASARLNEQINIEFAQTPLRDVISYVSEIQGFQIELLDEVDGDVEVTANSNGTVGELLDQMLHPLGLAAAPVGRKLVIGSPEAVQRLAAEAAAAAQAGKLRGNLIVLGGLVLIVAVIVLVVRRRAGQRRAVINADAGY
jgi:hypothetical protein